MTDTSLISVASLGGGHGLYQTLKAVRLAGPANLTAIVTVADDGGSSGRLRRELNQIPPGDLRMALAALADDADTPQMWAQLLQHRFGGTGALAGHAVGNLLLAGLTELLGSEQQALDTVTSLTNSAGRVLPMALEPLEIEADVSGLADDPRVMNTVRGQVAVATTPGTVRRVRLIPERPRANPAAVEALRKADLITLGPGSWFSSVIPHLLVPELVEAINDSSAMVVVVLNLSAEAGETSGFNNERHLHMLFQHRSDLRIDRVLVDETVLGSDTDRRYLERAAANLGAGVVYADLRAQGESGELLDIHDPEKLSAALKRVYRGS
ncbi:hypothetical protein C3B44_05335 [Corynebacterium yudongzhengii]|uniref:Putative gluconeogenesis factor n=1 Tax=Corynebacterium yudongzhengii TaxID=2080740 RepID=A0A2U1T8B5_9CORY|nr:uridine diphosphate-N-acetylglucosamine-binding protein YvcK [Corynebacterium yudongzhengii]AWB81851.1 hypothetical protein C3B44_05335 [Corynebacterium yudongzhengii]PWC02244.1 uridine diphosphate-N-acetylglucosamine-binding protein YvcK [Corynebacterium yudongzhengii]